MVWNVQIVPQLSSPPPEKYQRQVDPKVDPLPYSLVVFPSLSSSSPGESLDSNNQEAKKRKKRMKKKKK